MPTLTTQIIVGLFIIFAIIIFLKVGSLRINNKPIMKLGTRILIALFFPFLFIIALAFGSLFLLILIAFIITVVLLAIIFNILNKVKRIIS